MYSDEGNKKDLNFQCANIIGPLDLKIKLHLVSANRRLFLSSLDAPNHPRPLRKATSGETTVLKTALPPPLPTPGSVLSKALFWFARLLEWSTFVTLHQWPLSTGIGGRLPIHPPVKEQIVEPVPAWTSKLSKQAWQTLLPCLHILQLPSEGASPSRSWLSACHPTHQSSHHTRTGCTGSNQVAQ